ncbi:MAG: S8 family serine peptidase [Acidimicrobiales bacterium]
MRRSVAGVVLSVAAVATSLTAVPVGAAVTVGPDPSGVVQEFVVLSESGVDLSAARAAVARAGGRIVKENAQIGSMLVESTSADFVARAEGEAALLGAARNRPVGRAPSLDRPSRDDVERLASERVARRGRSSIAVPEVAPPAEPLAGLQWDMQQIRATSSGSYAVSQGSPEVLVGIIDTGINSSHPDIQSNFDARLSRNFTTDIPLIDGPCEDDPDGFCFDRADVDENGHGTHVASTIGSPINGLGIAGVAPKVRLVNLRAGQDSGYFFLQATLDAYLYAGENGIDVVNMSYFTDPWLFNCTDNPADSPAEQQEQRIIRWATQRAINYARARGVTPVSAAGNEGTDLGHPTEDLISPDYPPGNEKPRTIDNSCLSVPTETGGVISISSTGVSKRKAYYSNYGTEQTDFAAPGGDYYDTPTNTGDPAALVLAAYPKALAMRNGELNPDGTPNTPFVVRNCKAGVCAYYQYLQGTSMASPHAAGVAALIVGEYGVDDDDHPGLTLSPRAVQRQLGRCRPPPEPARSPGTSPTSGSATTAPSAPRPTTAPDPCTTTGSTARASSTPSAPSAPRTVAVRTSAVNQ